MSKVLYVLLTFLGSFLSIFGIRSGHEEAPYTIVGTIGHDIEIRRYGAQVAAETTATGDDFRRLFDFIAGANARNETIAMTAPVEQRGGRLAPRVGGDAAEPTMRFFLPAKVAANPPAPKDGSVRIVDLPARTVAAIRFSGILDRVQSTRYARILEAELAKHDRKTQGEPYLLGYDPPFTIPFLRRNEVAIDLAPDGS